MMMTKRLFPPASPRFTTSRQRETEKSPARLCSRQKNALVKLASAINASDAVTKTLALTSLADVSPGLVPRAWRQSDVITVINIAELPEAVALIISEAMQSTEKIPAEPASLLVFFSAIGIDIGQAYDLLETENQVRAD